MPPHEELERLIGTAVVDGGFRATLLESPEAASEGFDLTPEELAALVSANARTLEELAAHLYAWIVQAPQPRRAAVRWLLDNQRTTRIAV